MQSRGLLSWWCLKGEKKQAFLGLFRYTYRLKPEHVSKHCSVQQQHLPLSGVGCLTQQPLLRNDAVSFDNGVTYFKSRPSLYLRCLLAVCQNMDPFPLFSSNSTAAQLWPSASLSHRYLKAISVHFRCELWQKRRTVMQLCREGNLNSRHKSSLKMALLWTKTLQWRRFVGPYKTHFKWEF